jgi:hypothetical protein
LHLFGSFGPERHASLSPYSLVPLLYHLSLFSFSVRLLLSPLFLSRNHSAFGWLHFFVLVPDLASLSFVLLRF